MSSPEEELTSTEEEQEQEVTEQETQTHEKKPQRPAPVIHIETPLDRPEFDMILDLFMRKLGIKDRQKAAISLSTLMWDMGLDPNADLRDLANAVRELNSILGDLPDTPQTRQVKDTVGGMMASRVSRVAIDRATKQFADSDPMGDRFEKMMDKYMPYIIFMSGMGNMMKTGQEQPQQTSQQPAQNTTSKIEVPEEFKKQMDAMQTELEATKALLKQASREKTRKEFAESIVSTVHQNINPQIDALRSEVEGLAQSLQAQANQPQQAPQESQEMKDVARELHSLGEKLSTKAEAQQLSLDNVSVVLDTVEKIESRLKKTEPMGEFDWKAATVNSLSEIGKEAVSAFKEMSINRPPPAYQPQPQPQRQMSQSDRAQIIKRQMQNFIMNKVSQGQTQLDLREAASALNITFDEANQAYQILANEGWFKSQPGTPAQRQQPSAAPTQQPVSPPVEQPTSEQPFGGEEPAPRPGKGVIER